MSYDILIKYYFHTANNMQFELVAIFNPREIMPITITIVMVKLIFSLMK